MSLSVCTILHNIQPHKIILLDVEARFCLDCLLDHVQFKYFTNMIIYLACLTKVLSYLLTSPCVVVPYFFFKCSDKNNGSDKMSADSNIHEHLKKKYGTTTQGEVRRHDYLCPNDFSGVQYEIHRRDI